MKTQAIVCFFLLLTGPILASASHSVNEHKKGSNKCGWFRRHAVPLAAGGLAVAAAPVALGAAGFGAAGVAAGSLAAKAMAVFGTGGTVIPALQSAGAAGLGLGGNAAVRSVTSFVTSLFTNKGCDDEE